MDKMNRKGGLRMDQIRMGIVGLGDMALKHARVILENIPQVRIAAVASRNTVNIERLCAMENCGEIRVFDTPAQMYESGAIDAVLIASPHRAHVAQATEAFACGIHVLLEKPTGVYTAEVRRLGAAADASGCVFGVMLNQRTHPAYRKMKEIVSSGEMGEIRRVSYAVTDWVRTAQYYVSSPWRATWKDDGGGVLLNQAPHNLDLLQWICGMPVGVRAFCGFGRWHDVEIEDDVTAYMEFANGATGTFVTCTGEAPGSNRFEISLDGGQLVYENDRLTLKKLEMPVSRYIRENKEPFRKPGVTITDITPDEPYPKHEGVIRAFARHILYGETMVADGREGLNSLMLANAMLLSSWTDERIALPFDEAADERYKRLLAAKSGR